MEEKLMSKKKPTYPIKPKLHDYLKKYNRDFEISISYDDLLRFTGGINLYDQNDKDT